MTFEQKTFVHRLTPLKEPQDVKPDPLERKAVIVNNVFDFSTEVYRRNLFIADNHYNISHFRWLMLQLENLSAHGYKKLYIEKLFKEDHAEELKNIKPQQTISDDLNFFLKDLSHANLQDKNNYLYNYENIIKKAVELGIQVIPLNSREYLKSHGFGIEARNRNYTFPSNASKIIKATANDDKWICLIDPLYLNWQKVPNSPTSIRGLKQMYRNSLDVMILDGERHRILFNQTINDQPFKVVQYDPPPNIPLLFRVKQRSPRQSEQEQEQEQTTQRQVTITSFREREEARRENNNFCCSIQ
jgi:hypothetical protein